MKFFTDVHDSLAPGRLDRFRGKSFGALLWYLLRLALLAAIVPVALSAAPVWVTVAEVTAPDAVAALYPDDLVVTVASGTVSTNAPEPYVVPLPGREAGDPQNIVVIDTAAQDPIEAISRHDTAVLVTRTAVVGRKSTGEIRAYELAGQTFEVSETTVRSFAESARPWVKVAVVAIAALVVLAVTVGWLAMSLLLALVGAFAAKGFARHAGRPLTYGEGYAVAGYAMTLPIFAAALLDVAWQLAHGSWLNAPAWVTPALLVVALFLGLSGRKSDVPPPSQVA